MITLPNINASKSAKTGHQNESERLQKLKKLTLFSSAKKEYRVERAINSKFFYLAKMQYDDEMSESLLNDRLMSKERVLTNMFGIKKFDKRTVMSCKEKQSLNQNNIEENLMNMTLRNLNRQFNYNQIQIKREKSVIYDQYLDLKALSMTKSKSNIDDLDELSKNEKSFATDLNINNNNNNNKSNDDKSTYTTQSRSKTAKTTISSKLTASHQSEMRTTQTLINQPIKSYLDSITERFAYQKMNYYPNYLRKSGKAKSSSVYQNKAEHFLGT